VGLRAQGIDIPLRTKIEFSRRDTIEGAVFEPIERRLVQTYGLTPTLATHYSLHAAVAQKVHALAGRTEPQARDVFDLGLLFSRPDARNVELHAQQKAHLDRAITNAMAVSFDEYRSKVVAFLESDQADPYDDRAAWDAMQEGVVSGLEALRLTRAKLSPRCGGSEFPSSTPRTRPRRSAKRRRPQPRHCHGWRMSGS
jgi:hypothetical protein